MNESAGVILAPTDYDVTASVILAYSSDDIKDKFGFIVAGLIYLYFQVRMGKFGQNYV